MYTGLNCSLNGIRVATCAIFLQKVRYVRSICGVRWSALRLRVRSMSAICCVSIKYEFLFDKSRKIYQLILCKAIASNCPHIYGSMFLARQIMSYEQ